MAPDIFITSHNIFSPLGSTTAENFSKLVRSVSGVRRHEDKSISGQPFHAALFDRTGEPGDSSNPQVFTRFEKLLITSITDALRKSEIRTDDKKTVLLISSTKGNISLLKRAGPNAALWKRLAIHHSASLVAEHFGFVNKAIVVSNACISGLLAMLTGMRLIRSGQYENAVIAGADTISKFVLSGFQSFQAVSAEICRPFDRRRDGINLGEGAGTLILSSNKKYYGQGVRITGGSVSNDANHISGPSRTGQELCQAMRAALQGAHLPAGDIDFISAHGTATLYNDEMEARAIRMAGLQSTPVNSLKGYFGHTLGAAGLIESIVTIQSMIESLIIPTMGFEQLGVTGPLNICSALQPASLNNCLKTASGFGGCNAAVVFSK